MSASEKLRALQEDERRILDALPQIVAVVEAAEEWESYRENVGMMRVYAHVPKNDLRAALAALDEALQ